MANSLKKIFSEKSVTVFYDNHENYFSWVNHVYLPNSSNFCSAKPSTVSITNTYCKAREIWCNHSRESISDLLLWSCTSVEQYTGYVVILLYYFPVLSNFFWYHSTVKYRYCTIFFLFSTKMRFIYISKTFKFWTGIIIAVTKKG